MDHSDHFHRWDLMFFLRLNPSEMGFWLPQLGSNQFHVCSEHSQDLVVKIVILYFWTFIAPGIACSNKAVYSRRSPSSYEAHNDSFQSSIRLLPEIYGHHVPLFSAWSTWNVEVQLYKFHIVILPSCILQTHEGYRIHQIIRHAIISTQLLMASWGDFGASPFPLNIQLHKSMNITFLRDT